MSGDLFYAGLEDPKAVADGSKEETTLRFEEDSRSGLICRELVETNTSEPLKGLLASSNLFCASPEDPEASPPPLILHMG